jgi:pimeloyl-ACP methyl ester carboxylesterase
MGPTVMLIHGAGAGSSMWERTLPALAALDLEAIAVDLPGAAASDPFVEAPTLGSWAEACAATMRALGRERYLVAGHHTGAVVGLALAARHPDRVDGVFALGMPVLTPSETARFAVETPPAYDATGEVLMRWWRSHWSLTEDPATRPATVARSAAEMLGWGERRPQAHHALAEVDVAAMVRESGTPLRVAVGAKEMLRQVSEGAAELTDRGSFEELGDSGFYIAAERPRLLAEAIARFATELEDIDLGPSPAP